MSVLVSARHVELLLRSHTSCHRHLLLDNCSQDPSNIGQAFRDVSVCGDDPKEPGTFYCGACNSVFDMTGITWVFYQQEVDEITDRRYEEGK